MENANPYSPPSVPVDPPASAAPGTLDGRWPFIPGGVLGTTAVVFLAVALVLDLASAGTDLHQYLLLGRAKTGAINPEQLVGGVLYLAVWVLQLALLVGCTITFCMWFYRVYRNLRAMGITTAFTPGWAPGSFFVPFLNLVRPFQIARETWMGSEASGSTEPAGSGLVSLWWALFLGSRIIAWVGSRFSGQTMDSMQTAHMVFVISDLVSAGAALACILMIRKIDRRQQESYRLMAAGA
jgi:hypothetical protein